MSKKKTLLLIILIIGIIGAFGGIFWGITLFSYNSAEEPIFELPIVSEKVLEVTGIQTFHEEHNGVVHGGFDFKLENDTVIISPIEGKVTDIHKNQMDNDYWLVDVNIDINARWKMFIAFEPWTQDEGVIENQLENINVKEGNEVKRGDKLGTLIPVNGSEFPHIHWNVIEKGFGSDEDVDRSPYDYCSSNAKADLDYLCDKFDKPASYD